MQLHLTAGADFPVECKPVRDDYVECLHHAKEAKRRRAIRDELKRQEQLKANGEAPSANIKPENNHDAS